MLFIFCKDTEFISKLIITIRSRIICTSLFSLILLGAKHPAGINKFWCSLIGNLQENEKGSYLLGFGFNLKRAYHVKGDNFPNNLLEKQFLFSYNFSW